ncbi:methyl-accepting chemotaxis protein [Archangium minus]|uniref:methyl-accepting chemotaxis protein n=1 Tax=Archangium minus TaxID=83450 RepID=UPI0037BFBB89
MQSDEIKSLTKKIYNAYQINNMLGAAPLVLTFAILLGIKSGKETTTAIILAGVISAAFGAVPNLVTRSELQKAFAPTDPETRLRLILKVPRILEWKILGALLIFAAGYITTLVVMFDKSVMSIPWGLTLMYLINSLMWIQVRLSIESYLRPYAMKEFHRIPSPNIQDRGYLWPRQEWFLPYAFGIFIACTVATMLTIIFKSAEGMMPEMAATMSGMSAEQLASYLQQSLGMLAKQLMVPLLVVGVYILLNAASSAWRVARHQVEGARAVQESIEALVSGTPKLPAWVSTDEIGDLAQATSKAFAKLRALSLALKESAQSLGSSAQELGMSTTKQTEVLSRQAAALQETQVTAQEIKETSTLAFQKAENVLKETERADAISRAGEEVIEQSLAGLESIRQQVMEMARRIKELDGRTRQIGNITTTVKDLADQSNMLALNAAIEAVRSGEHGKGFAVVAREIRMLADQSIKATRNVRELLQDISTAIRTTVEITERGSARIDSSLGQVREFGNNIRQLSGIVRENAASVRQISAAVAQQNAGISQIFQAVNELSTMMDQTMTRLRSSEDAMNVVQGVVERVTGFVGEYEWESEELAKQATVSRSEPMA